MIEDKELRELFKAETAEHLQNLEAGLLRLEKEPDDKTTFENVFRDIHSLKGSSRMLGVKTVERISHRLEGMLSGVKKGQAALTPEFFDKIYKGLDAIKKLIREAVTGETVGVDVGAVLDFLEGRPIPEKAEEMAGPGAENTTPSRPGKENEPAQDASAPPLERYHIDTIRVETKKLDGLMTQAGELAVMRTRINRLSSQIEEIVATGESAVKLFSEDHARGGPLKAEKNTNGAHMGRERLKKLVSGLSAFQDALNEDKSRLEFISTELDGGIRDIRLLPFHMLFSLFSRMVRDMSRERSKEVELDVAGGDTKADKRIIEEMKDPIMHMIRNSIDHGIEPPDDRAKAGKPRAGKIRLSAHRTDTNIIIEVADDGRGLADVESIKKVAVKRRILNEKEVERLGPAEAQNLIFSPGFSTSTFVTDISGRGVGLDVVRTNVERLKGAVHVESSLGAGCLIRVKLPVTLATARVLLVAAQGNRYAIPIELVETTYRVFRKDIFHMEGRDTVVVGHQTIPVAKLADILELPPAANIPTHPRESKEVPMPCILLSASGEKFGVLVDDLMDEQEVVLKPSSAVLKRVRNVTGSTILGSGEICTVLNPDDMLKSMRKRAATAQKEPEAKPGADNRKIVVLLVEDSITTRTQEKRILESAGYEVVTAVNGIDALAKLAGRPFDAVVSDIMMPEMDGLAFTARLRQDRKYKDLPVILVTTLASDDDKKKGLEAGANAYIPKPSFEQKILLETLQRLV